jgi:hypothetical protein
MDYVLKYGRNTNIDIADPPEDVIDQGGLYAGFIDTADSMTILSSDPADAAAGTHARTIRIEGLDANYNAQSEDVSLNGITPVALSNSYLRIFRAYILTAGEAAVNGGNIDVLDSSGNIMARIPIGLGQTLQAVYTIPAIYTNAAIVRWWVQPMVTANTSVEMAIQTSSFGSERAWRTREWVQVRTAGAGAHYRDFNPFGIKVDPRDNIRIQVLSVTSDDTVVSGGFDVALGR